MKPAIFNTEMVRAMLDGRKTHTRRACLNIVEKDYGFLVCSKPNGKGHITPLKEFDMACKMAINHYAPYKVGDVIYVRETFSEWLDYDTRSLSRVTYKASDEDCSGKWKPSIHMPKECARLFLRVKDVRIERLNEISEEDAIKEGLLRIEEDDGVWYPDYIKWGRLYKYANSSFQTLWESIYGKDSFDNRYVWVIEFERISKEEAING